MDLSTLGNIFFPFQNTVNLSNILPPNILAALLNPKPCQAKDSGLLSMPPLHYDRLNELDRDRSL